MVQVNVFENFVKIGQNGHYIRLAHFAYTIFKLSQIVLNISGNSIKNGFVLVHISRFKQAIAIHTLQASSQDVKVGTSLQTCSKYIYFIV